MLVIEQGFIDLVKNCGCDEDELSKAMSLMRELSARLAKTSSFSHLKWSDVVRLAKLPENSNGNLGLPSQEPTSLESFQEMVGIQREQKSCFLPRATICEIVSRAYDSLAALNQASNSNEAEKVFVFDSIFITIIRLFNGAVTTLPEAPLNSEGQSQYPNGFADHKTITLGGISIILVELKRHLSRVTGLAQLLGEMIYSYQQNAGERIFIEVNGILTDGLKFLFIVLEPGTAPSAPNSDKRPLPRFKVKTVIQSSMHVDGVGFSDGIYEIVNLLFTILFGSLEGALNAFTSISNGRRRPEDDKENPQCRDGSAEVVLQRHTLSATKARREPGLPTRDSSKEWFEAYQTLASIQQTLEELPTKDNDGKKTAALTQLWDLVSDLREKKMASGCPSVMSQSKFRENALKQIDSFYESMCTPRVPPSANKAEVNDLSVTGTKRFPIGETTISDWCNQHGVAAETVKWLTDRGYSGYETSRLETIRLKAGDPVSIPLGHLLEIRRAADILVEKPVCHVSEYAFPDSCTVEEFLGTEYPELPGLMKEAEMSNMKAKVLQYLSFDHIAEVGWNDPVITALRTRAQKWAHAVVI
ncbi:hypothetical protein D9758_011971 [Tetrapyrgos nigripes]|uniref:Uncharacterized protein n=1 Tax=Tetrapyrgos nigripes TaxID=182062 RepID=A0A8H5D3Z0_9AGAR|nr:hypothetical protein D9758_011971 [Tetrapyrgos nigripes]